MSDNKKVISKSKFVIHIILSFIVWDFIINIVSRLCGNLLYELLKNNKYAYILGISLFLILMVVIKIFLTYYFNKKHRVSIYQFESTQNLILIIFYIFVIGFNLESILFRLFYSPIITIIIIVLEMYIIYIVNGKMFERYISDEKK